MQESSNVKSEKNEELDSKKLINASLIFARALGLILNDSEGIVVDVKGDIELGENVKKVIVFQSDKTIHVFQCDEDLDEGTVVTMEPKIKSSEEVELSDDV